MPVKPFPQPQELASDQQTGFCWSEIEPLRSTTWDKILKVSN